MTADERAPTRVEIALDVDDEHPDLLFLWAGVQATRLVEELRRRGICADLASIDVDGERRYRW